MIRYAEPFDGERFLLNNSTKEIHDLENESSMCHINQINIKNIKMYESENEVKELVTYDNCDGCSWCLPRYNQNKFL